MNPGHAARGPIENAEWELGQFIPLHYHAQMLASPARMLGFREAIAFAVPEGSVVLELGAGTGVLSYFAAQRAFRVYAVERLQENAAMARELLERNGVANKVTVIHADASAYLPPTRVDVVICELLHVALLREQQARILADFKTRYLARFGPPLPLFIPEGVFLAVQPVEQGFDFYGFEAPIPLFVDPVAPAHPGNEVRELAPPEIYAHFSYDEPYPQRFAWSGTFTAQADGVLNALRFVTRNILAVLPHQQRSVDWLMHYMVLPVAVPVPVRAGQTVTVSFDYEAGASIPALTRSLVVVAGA